MAPLRVRPASPREQQQPLLASLGGDRSRPLLRPELSCDTPRRALSPAREGPTSPVPWLLASPRGFGRGSRRAKSPSQPFGSPPPAAYYSAMLRARETGAAGSPKGTSVLSFARQAAEEQTSSAPRAVYRCVIFLTVAVFSGYACLVVLQERLGVAMGLEESAEFRHACSLNYVGNLVFRLAHNVVFACIRPRRRVYISLGAMAMSSGALAYVALANGSHGIIWVYSCYFLGGMAVGTFESNLLSAITPLGPKTKVWAILGMPLGFNLISIGGFAFLAPPLEVPLAALYMFVSISCCSAMAVFHCLIPEVDQVGNIQSSEHLRAGVAAWKEWLPYIRECGVALALDMFAVSFFTILMLYILNDKQWVPIFGQLDGEQALVNHDHFFACFGLCAFLGDSSSRVFAYWIKPRRPTCFLMCSVVGAALCLCEIPALALLGIFSVTFANGAIYGASTRFIDTHVPRRHNLMAVSMWLFVGDFGGVAGSNSWPLALRPYCAFVRARGQTHHYCLE